MIIIGELINSTRDVIKEKIEDRDKEYIQEIAKKQEEAGAEFIDVNAGAFVWDEIEHLLWLVEVAQEVLEKPLSLDSPNEKALEQAAEKHQGVPLINSITLEKERYDKVLPIVQEYDASVIALCMSDEGMPKGREDRVELADKLMNKLIGDGVPAERIFLDPIIQPISVDGELGCKVLDAVQDIRDMSSEVHITCGLSNISYGLPHRPLLNQAFMVMAIGRGMDSAIIDPLDDYMMKLIKAAEVISNEDAHGMRYLKASRAGKLD
ncbi:MAG: dihydropteroate synthase [Bacillota bacterium]